MSSPNSGSSLAERADIHKSCKSLETVVNILNDYCEVASAIVTLQKKLSKALREAAATKCNSEIAINALTASAAIFELLSDVDAKFAKAADKECDGVSTEVKKWFKKLAKEEKSHDERINGANARIKQAGQNYEKKAKKNARDAAEEHSRYINLLSALGPEMAQEKYHHALFVTQRHTVTTYNVASSIARVADAEWQRFCEGVRRSAPAIGRLGEWKALCEGGWTGPIPPDLADVDAPANPELISPSATLPTVDEEKPAETVDPPTPDRRREVYQQKPQGSPLLQTPVKFPSGDDASDHSRGSDDRKNSMTSLDNFPSPPTHFPIPPVDTRSRSPSPTKQPFEDQPRQAPLSPYVRKPSIRKVSTETPSQTRVDTSAPQLPSMHLPLTEIRVDGKPTPQASEPQTTIFSEPREMVAPAAQTMNDQEFGVQKRQTPLRAQTMEMASPNRVERNDSTRSSGSVVAAMRNRYAQNPAENLQLPTRETPRLPVSVSNIASRYQAIATNTSPPPTEERRQSSIDTNPRMPEPYGGSSTDSSRYSTSAAPNPDVIAIRRKRIEELEELEIREREHDLRMKEREVEYKTRELDRERARLMARNSAEVAPRLSIPQRSQQQQYDSPTSMTRPQHSFSTTHLVPPPASDSPSQPNRSQSRPVSPAVTPTEQTNLYSPPPVRPRVESKPKGWMRRLSMPLISSTDSSKKSNTGISSTNPQWRGSLVSLEPPRPSLDRPGTGGISNRNYRG